MSQFGLQWAWWRIRPTVADLHAYYVLAGATPVLVHNDDANDLGASREEYIARLVGGSVAKDANGQDIRAVMPNVGSTGLDVVGRNGEYIFVGGGAKAKNPANFGKLLKISKYVADEAGVTAQHYLADNTPDSAVAQARKVFGDENVHIFTLPEC
ncbi:hypothetical protein P3T36_001722 [Kitasatospora sp. MAP12-15]|uniref:hypothetical protein n=1 Tax=unclassified Kitasatospora TaxID=2633591 RepID=UPI002475C1F6|nr:hypothetical protein [Kitasatospora sp. MAP12-44]MDH6113399.1 hypothetical protein [Kitasatospora sp. MAP12-44]